MCNERQAFAQARINMKNLGGIHAVLYALFDANGALDRRAMARQVALMHASNVDGVSVLGLATEVQKLSPSEQREIITWAAEDVGGTRPFSVTISGNSANIQRDLISFALAKGADWLILQPPTAGAYSGETYLDFFLTVADGFDAPFAIQNAPQYLGRSLSSADVVRLVSANHNFSVIKSETSAIDLANLVETCGDKLTVLNGRGGLEMTDCLRAGARGFVLAPDVIDISKVIFDRWNKGDYSAAELSYQEILPAIVFMMQSIEHLICYGKRIFGARADIEIFDRAPALAPTEFGIQVAETWAKKLGPLDR